MSCIIHDLVDKREYLEKGETNVWQECRNCDFKTEKRQQWSVGAIEMIWNAIWKCIILSNQSAMLHVTMI